MTDISREKLEAFLKKEEKPEMDTDYKKGFNYALFIVFKASNNDELDADPWIPVSTPPVDQRALASIIDKVYAVYMPEPVHSSWNKALDTILGELAKLKSTPPVEE